MATRTMNLYLDGVWERDEREWQLRKHSYYMTVDIEGYAYIQHRDGGPWMPLNSRTRPRVQDADTLLTWWEIGENARWVRVL